MNNLYELLLSKPLSDRLMELLLFGVFVLHLIFVLLMIGTAMISVYFFLHSWFTNSKSELHWDKRILRTHLTFKSLAVVLGVGPLLIIQVVWSVPFFTAASLLAPYWLMLTLLMIIAFLLLDLLGHKIEVKPFIHLVVAVLGLAVLLVIPAIFTGVLTLFERPGSWASVAQKGMVGNPNLWFHWLMRYLHVLGAAALVGAVFHYFYSLKGKKHCDEQYHLSKWIILALIFQIFIGILLLISVTDKLDPAILWVFSVGILATLLFLTIAFFRYEQIKNGKMTFAMYLLPVILIFMLLGRQLIQQKSIAPFERQLSEKTAMQKKLLEPFHKKSLAAFHENLTTVYDNGATIYKNSCAFCHGIKGDGMGADAKALLIPPEKLNAVRSDRNYIYQILLHGIPGSGMPYFSYYDKDKLESLMDYMDSQFGTFRKTAHIAPYPGDGIKNIWNNKCAQCHGKQGQITAFGKKLKPAPPDFTKYVLTPDYAYEIITEGYPGTAMQPFNMLADSTRHKLADLITGFYTNHQTAEKATN